MGTPTRRERVGASSPVILRAGSMGIQATASTRPPRVGRTMATLKRVSRPRGQSFGRATESSRVQSRLGAISRYESSKNSATSSQSTTPSSHTPTLRSQVRGLEKAGRHGFWGCSTMLTRQNGHDPQYTRKEVDHDRIDRDTSVARVLPSACPSRKPPIDRSLACPPSFDAPWMTTSGEFPNCSRRTSLKVIS